MGKKVTYKVKNEEPSLFVLAINTTEDDYHLAWLLNNALKISLTRAEHFVHSSAQNFSTFYFLDDISGVSYTLVANKIEGKHLLSQLKNVDYLLKISGTLTDNLKAEILLKIRSLYEITACILIKTENTSLLSFFNNL